MVKLSRNHIRISIVLLAAAGAGIYLHFFVIRSMGEGPAGPAVSPLAFESVWTERPVLLLGLGDSVTTGYGASPGKSYVARLAKNPEDEFEDMAGLSLEKVLPNLTVLNRSVNGSTSIDHLRDQLPYVAT
jgi:hypothetical protein